MRGKWKAPTWKSLEKEAGMPSRKAGSALKAAVRASVLLGGIVVFLFWLNRREANREGGANHLTSQLFVLRQVVFVSDGDLNAQWLKAHFKPKEKTALNDIDLKKLRDKFRAIPQVKKVVVEKQLPHTLKITIEERKKMLRILFVDKSNKRHVWFVAEDGEVYPTLDVASARGSKLPLLRGIALKKAGLWVESRPDLPRFKKVKHAPYMGQFLEKARTHAPSEVARWRQIELMPLRSEGELGFFLVVVDEAGSKIIFGPEPPQQQLDKLANILEWLSLNSTGPYEIDLSFDSPVVRPLQND